MALTTSILLMVVLAGCAGKTDAVKHTTATRVTGTATPLPTSTPIPLANPKPVSMQAAWGNVAVRRLPTALGNNRVFVFENAATPDGQWLVGEDEPRNFLANTALPCYAMMYNASTQQHLRMHPLLHPQSQIVGASADDHWVVWAEAADQPSFYDWTLFAYNRDSGRVTQLAQAVQQNGQAVRGPYPMPVVDHGQVVWGQAIGPVGPDTLSNGVVYQEDLATGMKTTLATKAGYVALSWPWVLWDQATTGQNGYVAIKNLGTGQLLQWQSQPNGPELSGTSVSYWDATTGMVYLIDDMTKSPINSRIVLPAGMGQGADYATLNKRLVTWSSNDTTFAYDRAEQRLVTLPVSRPAGINWVGGHLLVWLDPVPQAQQDADSKAGLITTPMIDLVDTNSLALLSPQ